LKKSCDGWIVNRGSQIEEKPSPHQSSILNLFRSSILNPQSSISSAPQSSILNPQSLPMTGIGYDVHRFAENRPLVLGGVTIPHTHGLDGHSDADVLCHALADALLGAMGLPDIGHYFPPGDPACKDLSSLRILEKCRGLADALNFLIVNVDATLVAEAPKVLPYREAMRANISTALGIPPQRVGIKATTNETMGFIGRREGIAALAVAQIEESIPF
jgi:2-C-methyl-D-erythritol 2,4-cyclodiphosphate synthase